MTYIQLHSAAKNITGQRYGRLLALGPVSVKKFASGANHVQWLCRCDCGNEKVISIAKLTTKNTKSCGCFQKESRMNNKGGLTHGMHGTPEYETWHQMIQRCHCRTSKGYKNYGGRGIAVCAEWRNDFPAFLSHVGPRPSSKHSIDRYPDNDGSYEPGNVRWATAIQQGRNRRTNRIVHAFGRSAPLADFFADGSKCRAYDRALQRLKIGWSIERAIGAGLYG